jgi:hypothetical protein
MATKFRVRTKGPPVLYWGGGGWWTTNPEQALTFNDRLAAEISVDGGDVAQPVNPEIHPLHLQLDIETIQVVEMQAVQQEQPAQQEVVDAPVAEASQPEPAQGDVRSS